MDCDNCLFTFFPIKSSTWPTHMYIVQCASYIRRRMCIYTLCKSRTIVHLSRTSLSNREHSTMFLPSVSLVPNVSQYGWYERHDQWILLSQEKNAMKWKQWVFWLVQTSTCRDHSWDWSQKMDSTNFQSEQDHNMLTS